MASVVWADTKVPPGLGVWAEGRRAHGEGAEGEPARLEEHRGGWGGGRGGVGRSWGVLS